MTEPKHKKPDPAKTVFMPSGSLPPAAEPSAPPESPASDSSAEDAWFSGEEAAPVAPPPRPAQETPPSTWDQAPAPATSSGEWTAPMPDPAPYYKAPAPEPPKNEGRIAIGMTLNHIFEVRRFIARGGMGEVYEGVNINTDERVAIKVILSHLALDANVREMFLKEARTLTRLSHPALVQYRVLAQEPTLGVLYIVTEYIDGQQLSDVIGVVRPNESDLIGLTRRLASGLQAAHELGAIHRDIAPDNVLLPEGRLSEAKIIDFGIAKDLDPSTKTIVGDGFAGKLGFVAPEQFGDYNREVGPWTDVYSLALVLLSVAAGRPIDMGATLVEAIDKRRAGPDLSAAPERLRPVLAGMLRPNPAERFRSMSEVLKALDEATGVGQPPMPPPTYGTAQKAKPRSQTPLILAGIGALVLIIGLVGFFVLGGKKDGAQVAGSGGALRDSEKVRAAVEAALPSATCTWIDIDSVNDGPGGVSIRLSGVAGSPVQAQQTVMTAAKATGATIEVVDSSNVFPVGPQSCAPLDAFRALREPNSATGRRFTSQQSNWELSNKNDPCVGPNAKAVVDIDLRSPDQNFSLIGMDKTGGLQQIFADRAAFKNFQSQYPELVTDKGGDHYSSTSCYNETGLVGQLLVTGPGPFNLGLPDAMVTDKSKPVDSAWLANFTSLAKAGGWKTNMVWYRVVDDQAG